MRLADEAASTANLPSVVLGRELMPPFFSPSVCQWDDDTLRTGQQNSVRVQKGHTFNVANSYGNEI